MNYGWMKALGPDTRSFSIAVEAESFRGVLPEGLSWQESPSENFSVEILDTHSWGIWASGLVLFRRAGLLTLWDQESAKVVSEEDGPAEGGFFWWDLKRSDFVDRLTEAAGIRKVERVVCLNVAKREFEVFNGEGKIVFRFLLVTLCGGEGGEQCSFVARPLRGYETEASACCKALEALVEESASGGLLDRALAAAGVTPNLPDRRPLVELDPGLPSLEALRRVVHPALELAWENEPGIIRDTDTEFLHDYRVALRKARSALALMSGVYAASEVSWIRREISRMASVTNRLRDLDVYLLTRREYEHSVPAVLRSSVRGLFDILAGERTVEQERVAAALLSEGHQRLKYQISNFFASPGGLPPGEEAETPARVAVGLRLERRYRKIRKIASVLGPEASDSELHRLRIQCKKLRYLLEFFSPVVPETATLLAHPLRRLQSRLGALNDASVQREFLIDLWHRNGKDLGIDSAVALGVIVGILHARRTTIQAGALRALAPLTKSSLKQAVQHSLEPTL